ncbi:rare lipoprotein A [Sulfurifustis variabilis]|uniref:Endolytic peptidoglycan transglycosylase RlpA n=1 Tax=Sulfurifustis variabilis TaxID=1675686 RepID=A0A1B4V016_9GAMM|nr:septal ring lytic transglycosylase RlpA family protein [Sulfurifustis variabilis]BAU46758.1 rare lipoprotein A [Sulfurifustis variabilis]
MIVRLPLFALALLLAACGTVPQRDGYYQDDGPHERAPVDLAAVPDAVPRAEPLSESGNRPYTVFGVGYTPLAEARGYRERGVASWYGKKFHGRRTSSGEPYDMYAMTAAHKTLPLPSYARVRNLENGRSVVVRVNDRGPFLHNRLIDLSYAAAWKLGIAGSGTGIVEVETLDPHAPPAPATTVASRPRLSVVSAAQAGTEPHAGPRLSVQVGAFTRHANAVALRDRLERAGLAPIYIQAAGDAAGGATPLYRVRIGPVASVEQGDRLVEEAGRQGVPDALIVVD